ncbi:polysaccharide deacetylase family protein [Sinisalibacter aestuarii]|uniref:Chitooligosaccharide deacetylase n=1 Tax=Sinisalibacter aestuarii TaxID=2949426 RepID=A0ABQ5LT49_9RHOB|nr:polysaccharide deacetylase family protein [Sinisalibacter aestuarii]GKY88148.1 polysaccharide deacetylase [Sinisalibacter aestuarii]
MKSGGVLNILTYHAVTPGAPPLDDWCFLPARSFAAQMAFLHRFGFDVVPLAEGVEALQAGRLKRRSVAITFDDGYRNNLTTALPILEKYGYPATVFVVSGFTGSDKTLWPNRVVAALEATAKPAIELEGQHFPLGSRDEKVRASRDLQRLIKVAFAADPNAGAAAVERACGTAVDPGFGPDHDFAMMDTAMMRETAARGLIEFGAHTVTHPILSKLSDADLDAEITGSVASVAEAAGRPCRTFAYPNGSYDDFDDRAVTLLRASGVSASVTTFQDRARPDDDPFYLPRWDIGSDITLARFGATVSGVYPFRLSRAEKPRLPAY